jgi:hypothetical protein
VNHIIRFQRPESPSKFSDMSVSGEAPATTQIRHLEGLGYTIVDVSPPLPGWTAQRTDGLTAADLRIRPL